MNRFLARSWPTLLLFIGLALVGAAFLTAIGIDALEGRNHFEFFADSETYMAAARGEVGDVQGLAGTISVGANFLGPLVILKVAAQNYFAIMVICTLLMFIAVNSIARSVRIDPMRYSLLLLLNPLTFSSMLSVNKEVIAAGCFALILIAWRKRSAVIWLIALALSFLVRWQMALFIMTLLAARSSFNPFRKRRWLTLLALLVGMSVIYWLLADIIDEIRYDADFAAEQYDYAGSGLFTWMMAVQSAGLYWLIFPFKAAHLLFGTGLRFDRLIAPTDYYNDGWQLLHSTVLLLLFMAMVYRRRFRLSDDLVFISVLYIAVFAITPIYTPRYFYPVYLLWAAAYLRRPAPAPRVEETRAHGAGPAPALLHG